MSWHGGSRIFSKLSEAIEAREDAEISEKELFVTLVQALKDEGWDPQEAQLGDYAADAAAREALRTFGVVEICGAEHPTEPWQCDEETGHDPDLPHKDYLDRTWRGEENR
jgi:hypothetical protein